MSCNNLNSDNNLKNKEEQFCNSCPENCCTSFSVEQDKLNEKPARTYPLVGDYVVLLISIIAIGVVLSIPNYTAAIMLLIWNLPNYIALGIKLGKK